jgi:hypothetical protein
MDKGKSVKTKGRWGIYPTTLLVLDGQSPGLLTVLYCGPQPVRIHCDIGLCSQSGSLRTVTRVADGSPAPTESP